MKDVNQDEIKKNPSTTDKLIDLAAQKGATFEKLVLDLAAKVTDHITEKPTVSENAEKFPFSEESSSDLKGFASGLEKGKVDGHNSGFTKGVIAGAALAVTILKFVR